MAPTIGFTAQVGIYCPVACVVVGAAVVFIGGGSWSGCSCLQLFVVSCRGSWRQFVFVCCWRNLMVVIAVSGSHSYVGFYKVIAVVVAAVMVVIPSVLNNLE